MTQPTFNKEDFLKGAESGGFEKIPNGVYHVKVADTKSYVTDEGARCSAIGYQIDDEDQTAPGQYIWDNHYTIKKDGEVNHQSIGFYNKMLMELSSGLFSPDDFEWDENNNIVNEETVLSRLEGTECTVKIRGKEKDGFINYRINIQKVLQSSYSSSSGKPSSTTEDNTEKELETTMKEEVVPEETSNDAPQSIKPGDRIGWLVDDVETYGTVNQLIGDEKDGMVLIRPVGAKPTDLITKKPEELFMPLEVLEEEVELEVIEENLVLKVDGIGAYEFKGETLKGEIKKIDEDEGKVHFHVKGDDGKTRLRKVDIKSVKPVMS